MTEQFEKFANEVEADAEKMQFKTNKQIDDFIASLDNDNED